MLLLKPNNDKVPSGSFDVTNKSLANNSISNKMGEEHDHEEEDQDSSISNLEDLVMEIARGCSSSFNDLTDIDGPALQSNQQNDSIASIATAPDDIQTLSSRKKKKGGVSFGTVRVHTHQLRLGDNPAVSHGLPTELEWDHIESETFDLGDCQDMDSPRGPRRISIRTRHALLEQRGHTRSSFMRVDNEVRNIKHSRKQTKEERKKEKELIQMLNDVRKREQEVIRMIAEERAKKEKEIQKAKEFDEYKLMATSRPKKGKSRACDSARKWPGPPSSPDDSSTSSSKSSRSDKSIQSSPSSSSVNKKLPQRSLLTRLIKKGSKPQTERITI